MTLLTIAKVPTVFALGAVTALMTPTDIKEIIIAVGVLIAGVGVVIVNIITARSAAKRQEATLRKVEVIEGQVNSEKTEAAGKLAAVERENALLREIMADKKETAALLAQAVATQPVAVVLPVSVAPAAAEPAALKQIEKHTKETADNTSR